MRSLKGALAVFKTHETEQEAFHIINLGHIPFHSL